ncbi:MAG: LssY C-terminal domain-containing protein [Acidobacteria bacterium]|nr:LssY C-terminal domain-containing protein [Acidobacteriota bacterium]
MTEFKRLISIPILALLVCSAGNAVEVPQGTLMELRLLNGIRSYSSKAGQPLEAVLVAPILLNNEVAVPAGAKIFGKLIEVKRVGSGVVHERASIKLQFDRLEMEGKPAISIETRLFQIENSREKLDASGKVRGIRSTNTPGFRAAGVLTGLAAVDPIALLFSTAAFGSTLRFSEPEINWGPGAELIVEVSRPFDSHFEKTVKAPTITSSIQERVELQSLVERLPNRTRRAGDNKKSDLTNLIFIGKPEAVERAFAAAGWVQSAEKTASTRYKSLRAFAETQPFQEAPMSELLLENEPAVMTLSKTLNTFTRRHHLRVYLWKETWDGMSIYQAAATHDTDIVVSWRQRTVTHAIDERIDEERAKVVNDLIFTGCVDGSESIARPWIPEFLQNGDGQPITTDRSIVALRLNNCLNPKAIGSDPAFEQAPAAGSLFDRGFRQTMLRMKNDVLRGNLIWQGASWAYRFSRMLKKEQLQPDRRYERQTWIGAAPELAEASKANWEDGNSMIAPAVDLPKPKRNSPSLMASDDWGIPTVELGFSFGTSLFCKSTVGDEAWILPRHPMTGGQVALTAGNQIRPGWAVGGTVTVHTNRWFSNELGFHYLRGNYFLGLHRVVAGVDGEIPGLVEQRAGLLTRQFSYSSIVHARPVEARFRPYIAAGPALQLVHLTDAPFRSSKGIYRLGLSNVGLFRSAYNFGSAPPLDGGGIFQPAVQFGGGLKYRYKRCWVLRLDYRSTVSHRPNLLKKSLATIVDEITPTPNDKTNHWFAQQKLSLGFSFTF